MFKRTLGNSDIEVSALGLGCWAIGGPFTNPNGEPVGWGDVDDDESVRAIYHALDLGITFFDTANVYGTGHSEQVLGRALKGRRDQVVIATKFGYVFEEGSRHFHSSTGDPQTIRQQCEDSLRRLQTDVIDLYQFHVGDFPLSEAGAVRDTCEKLVQEGKIRTYAWSTDDPERARFFGEGVNGVAVQYRANIYERNDGMVEVCREMNLAGLIRGPLARGFLTGKFTAESSLPVNDVRHGWKMQEGDKAEGLEKLAQLREILTADGAEWIWNTTADLFPDSIQIIDWYHASQHLADAAKALYPDDQVKEKQWFKWRQDDLFQGNIWKITQPLDQHNLTEHSHYFHVHQRRMQYQEFQENGYPIGSGTVESGVKQFKARLTGSGMRWSRQAADWMLLLRAAILGNTFDHLWAIA